MGTATFGGLSFLAKVADRVAESTDSEATSRIKATLIGSMFFVVPNGLILITLYLYFNEPTAAAVVLGGMIISLIGFAHFIYTRRLEISVYASLASLLVGPFLITLALGGFVNSSVVILYTAIIPVGAVAFGRTHEAPRWYAAALGLLVIAGILQSYIDNSTNLPPELADPILIVLNIGAASGLAFGTLNFVVRDRDRGH